MKVKNHPFQKTRLSLIVSAFLGINLVNAEVITVSDQCSLIEAILAANQDTPIAGCEGGSGEDVIELPQGRVFSYEDPYSLLEQSNVSGQVELNALPIVRESLTINGHGSIIERGDASEKEFRLIGTTLESPPKTIQLTLNDLTLRNGLLVTRANEIASVCGGAIKADLLHKVILNNSIVSNNKADSGGGICGSVELNHSTVSSNTSISNGGGIHLSYGEIIKANNSIIVNNRSYSDGGGISSFTAKIEIIESTITGNSAANGAGFSTYSIPGRRGSLSSYCKQSLVERSVISNNIASQNGGGIRELCTLDLIDSTVANNQAVDGAGIYLHPNSHAKMAGSTISGNSAKGNGGGIYGTVEVINSTISDNVAQKGGGFFGEPTLINATLTNNQADQAAGIYITLQSTDFAYTSQQSFQIINTVIANNADQECVFNTQLDDFLGKLTFEPNLNNWFGDISCDGNASGDPLLANLADNGGLTLTHKILPGSPLNNAGNTSFCLNTALNKDQRGIQRLDDSFCDIGAYEASNSDGPVIQEEPPVILAGNTNINHIPIRVDFITNQAFDHQPVVILGPLSYNGFQPATIRITQTDSTGFSLMVQEYNYLDGLHVQESADYLAIPPGVYQLTDNQGTTILIEAGFIELGSGTWKKVIFNADFSKKPSLLTTVQTYNGKDAVTERIRKLDQTGFEVKLYEEERLNPFGHIKETVGYIAVYSSNKTASITVNEESAELRVNSQISLDHQWQMIDGNFQLKIEEEQSLDIETHHLREIINMVTIGQFFFAEDISGLGLDTSTIRKLQ